jgi:magnesium chelatase family protein
MSVGTLLSSHIVGLRGEKVTVEVDVSSGLYHMSIIGLPDKAIDESKDRIIAALKNTGLRNPKTENHRVIVSLSPADTKKEGSHFDLPILITYLIASKQLTKQPNDVWFFGTLSLTGELLPITGTLSLVECAKRHGAKEVYVPYINQEEAALVRGINVYGVRTVTDLILHLGGTLPHATQANSIVPTIPTIPIYTPPEFLIDFKDIQGQATVKRALEIAAAGGHNIAMYGPPGTGKTMLARAFTGILPPLSQDEIIEVTRIHSVSNAKTTLITHPPLRSPHHTSSYVSLVGGGTYPRPGEVSLAHLGVLFLDEFPEFDGKVIESLREPLEEGSITVSRAKGTHTFPASCILIASMNPCPCGYLGSKVKRCTCAPHEIAKYKKKLSGPIIDRIDMWVPVQHINYDTLSQEPSGEDSAHIRSRVERARYYARRRFANHNISSTKNRDIKAKDITKIIPLTKEGEGVMKKMSSALLLSPRSYHRILRLARTIADLRQSDHVEEQDILEAFQYRPKIYDGM